MVTALGTFLAAPIEVPVQVVEYVAEQLGVADPLLQRDGHPTPLGHASARYGRIFKSLHVLTDVDDEPYRRDIKAIRNLQEGRHDLAKHVFHGREGELRHRYQAGMEDQLGRSAWS